MENAANECAAWAKGEPISLRYHAERWGRPLHDDRELFALLCLEGQQAGLSWSLILRREAVIRAAFDDFDPAVLAAWGPEKQQALLETPGVIHNRAKIRAASENAAAFLRVQAEYGSFDRYLWHFTGGVQIMNHPRTLAEVPAQSPLSEAVSADLKKRGFCFVGPVIIYSYLQAAGVINDHLESCPYKYPRTAGKQGQITP